MRYPKLVRSLLLLAGCVLTVLAGSPPALQASDRPPGVLTDVTKGTDLTGFCFIEYTHYNNSTKKALAANMALRLEKSKGAPVIVFASNVPGTADCGDGTFTCQDTANLPASAQSVLNALGPQIKNAFGFPDSAVIGVADLTKLVALEVQVEDTVFLHGPRPETVASQSRVVMCNIALIVS